MSSLPPFKTSGMQIPKGEKGALHTVPAKEFFGNFTKWLDLIPAITKSLDALKEVVDTATRHTVSGDVQADLIITGNVSGSCKLEAKADKLEADKSAVIGASVGAKIEAKIEGEAKWLFFHVKAGATADLASAKSKDDAAGINGKMTFAPPKKEGGDIDFSGDVKCTGMAVYLGVYAQLGGEKKDDVSGNDTAGGGVADGEEESEQPAQNTAKEESGFKLEKSCNFVILNEFSFKDVLLHNTPPPELSQYPDNYGMAVKIEDDMLKDAQGNIVGAMDNHATMPDMSKPHF